MTESDTSTAEGETLERDILEGEIILPDEVRDHVKGSFDDQKARVTGKFWQTTRKALRHIPFMEDVVSAYYCAMDSKTPFRVRAALIGALAYFVLPLDAIPDILALIGFSDDASVLLAVLAIVSGHITDEHRSRAKSALEEPDQVA